MYVCIKSFSMSTQTPFNIPSAGVVTFFGVHSCQTAIAVRSRGVLLIVLTWYATSQPAKFSLTPSFIHSFNRIPVLTAGNMRTPEEKLVYNWDRSFIIEVASNLLRVFHAFHTLGIPSKNTFYSISVQESRLL